jgi:hypothetical protein
MATLLNQLSDLNDLILQGHFLEAFDRYYPEDVVMQENSDPPTVGKEANRQRESQFVSALTEFRSAKPLKVAIGESIAIVEWHYDFTHRDWGVRNFDQVSVQEWKDGKIISEKFYYQLLNQF